MKRGAKIALVTLGVLVLLVGAVAVYALTPAKPKPYEDPIPLEVREANSAGSIALVRLGIDNFTVDASDERILLAYEVPAAARGNQSLEERYQYLVLGAGAAAAKGSQKVVALAVVDGKTARVWSADVADLLAFEAGDISIVDLDAKILKG